LPTSPLFPYTTLFRSLGLLVFLHTTVGETAAFNTRGFREKFVRSIPTAPTSFLFLSKGLAHSARQQKAAITASGVGQRINPCGTDRKSTRLNSSHGSI